MSGVTRSVDVVKQFIANFERKQRNLMKRKGKLDSYRDQLNRGEALNEEQKKAVESYEGVLQSLSVVHEVLAQSKDLVSDVETCCKAEELQKEAEHEKYTLSFLHMHVCLMRLLTSLDQNDVRVAVARASSENSLKMLDIVRHLLLPPISDWPSAGSPALSNIPAFLQTNSEVNLAAQHTLNFVLGRPVSIPIPDNYDGSHKKFNFKEARNLCFRLLATPAVRRSMDRFGMSDTLISPVHEEVTQPVIEPASSSHDTFQPTPEFMGQVDTHQAPNVGVVPTEFSQHSSRRMDPPAHTILDQVIKPLGGTFNFLQASSVMTSDPPKEISALCTQLPASSQMGHDMSDTIDSHISTSNACYTQAPLPNASSVLYDLEPKSELNGSTESGTREAGPLQQVERNQVAVESDSSVPIKPISYADLVRRSGHGRPALQQDPYLSGSTQEVRKIEHVVSEPHNVYDSGDTEPIHPAPSWSRGSRGFNRGFSQGNPGSSRRAVGGARWNRIGTGAGRGGGGGHYRGAPPSVAQPSY